MAGKTADDRVRPQRERGLHGRVAVDGIAWRAGVEAQAAFDKACRQIGSRALEFCHAEHIMPVIVLGRNYTHSQYGAEFKHSGHIARAGRDRNSC